MKRFIFILIIPLFSFCQKEYDCVCYSNSKKHDTLITKVNTTKLGSKGFKGTCVKNESQNSDLTDCRLQ